jgi:hypothetical protein
MVLGVAVVLFERCSGAPLTGAESGQCIAAAVAAWVLLIRFDSSFMGREGPAIAWERYGGARRLDRRGY